MTKLAVRESQNLRAVQELNMIEAPYSDKMRALCYEVSGHDELPHVVKFSGGKSSGLLLFILLEAGMLKAERGDVVVFNNTSAEHPATYDFVGRCKELTEAGYGIPFFLIEFQTYEDARNREWSRLPTYRLVHPTPWSETNLDGYHWRGEVFEEMLSWKGYTPNQFKRTCTSNLKLEPTRAFLKDWFACKQHTERLGHFGKSSRLDDDELYERHIRSRGNVPRDIFLWKKAYVRSRPVFRPSQRFADYSQAASPISNPHLEGKCFGDVAFFGVGGVEYLAFVGLRNDEKRRVMRVRQRNAGGPESVGYEGEHVYLPLSDIGVTKEEVEAFWEKQTWGLSLHAEDGLSNCTYCFLKGARGLHRVHAALESGFQKSFENTPCDLQWWVEIEEKYGRDLEAEKRDIRSPVADNFIGFFGTQSGFSYQRLAQSHGDEAELSRFANSVLPCDCTD